MEKRHDDHYTEKKVNRKRSTSTLANTISFTHTRTPADEDKTPTRPSFGYLNKNGSSSTLNSVTHTLSNVGFTSIAHPQSPYIPESSTTSATTSPVLGKVESKLLRAKQFAVTKTKELKRSKTMTEAHNTNFLKRGTHGHHGLSSSSSNSKVVDAASTMYSFDPSQILDRDAILKQLTDINTRYMSFEERDHMGDTLWATITNALRSLFRVDGKKGLRLKMTIEDLGRMVEVYFRLRVRNNTPATIIVRDMMDFLKEEFNVLENELGRNDSFGSTYYYKMSSTWEYFFRNIYHYLLAVFQPMDAEMEGMGTIVRDKAYWSEAIDSQLTPSMRKVLLLSFRDHVVLPYFEMNIQIPALEEKERKVMVQCFGMLKSVRSTSYSQRIIEHISGILEQQLVVLVR